MYEADSNNAYSAKLLFHLLSGGVFVEPIYTTVDLDGDGKLELAMLVGADLYVFKSNTDNQYYLWYLKREDTADGVAFYDFNRDGCKDMIISKFGVNSQGRGWTYAPVYLASKLVSVKAQNLLPSSISLLFNYPNPFNPTTALRFDLPEAGIVSLVVYDVLGREVAILANGYRDAGYHSATWNAAGQASGVYFARFNVSSAQGKDIYSKVNKLVLMK